MLLDELVDEHVPQRYQFAQLCRQRFVRSIWQVEPQLQVEYCVAVALELADLGICGMLSGDVVSHE